MARAPRSLTGEVVAITGGGRGIGRATAAALLAAGARVAIGDIEPGLAARTASELGSGALGLELDVTDSASFAAFLDEAERQLGAIDVVINNAGIMPVGPFDAESEATARRLVDINLNGVIIGSKLALQRFLPRGQGWIVNIASVAGKGGFPGGATYCATKHAVAGLSETIRAEYRRRGIKVTTVCPTVVHTELGSGLNKARGMRYAEPQDVAAAIVRALQTGRPEVYVPREMSVLMRLGQVLPRPVFDFFTHVTKADQVLYSPDHAARAAYEQRMAAEEAARETTTV
ncbi:MAG TPA: SDR family NAD(P)-dependent oxidoreductase [Solirubrobacteraceae bacterium]|jgi:NAD(P)-dependent dehydrogenase (short-subunit alcohol dehydrogenase family)